LPDGTWWARVTLAQATGLLLASNDGPATWRERAHAMFGDDAELAELSDDRRGAYRAAAFIAGRLEGCLFIGPAATAPQWDAVKALFETGMLNEAARRVSCPDVRPTVLPAPGRSSAPASAWD
jgi:assimilatory nitrate reductase catalytic subunit